MDISDKYRYKWTALLGLQPMATSPRYYYSYVIMALVFWCISISVYFLWNVFLWLQYVSKYLYIQSFIIIFSHFYLISNFFSHCLFSQSSSSFFLIYLVLSAQGSDHRSIFLWYTLRDHSNHKISDSQYVFKVNENKYYLQIYLSLTGKHQDRYPIVWVISFAMQTKKLF